MTKSIFIFIFTILFGLFFGGCSSRQYYKPKQNISDDNFKYYNLKSTIIETNNKGAVLENFDYITSKGVSSKVKDNFYLLNYQNDIKIFADLNSTIILKTNQEIKKIKFKQNVIFATAKDNLLALGFVDNSIALYDTTQNKMLFHTYFKKSVLNDTKIANPIILQTLILYPTLDGKVAIFGIKQNKIIKVMNIDPKSQINNIIFLYATEDSLIAATQNKLFSFIDGEVFTQELHITHIAVSNDSNIYLTTLDGRVFKYDKYLKKQNMIKFKFANFVGCMLDTNNNLILLESQGYIIKLSKDFKTKKIFQISFDESYKTLMLNNKIYFDDTIILIPSK
jgi:WD40 repeat protein